LVLDSSLDWTAQFLVARLRNVATNITPL
jgi:hypothetical protein